METEDFKYVLQDLTNIYIGAKYSYGELMNLDEVPFKLKTIFSHYMLKEVAEETKIENHISYLEEDSLSFMAYRQMKARFRLSVWHGAKGPKAAGYRSREYKIEEILSSPRIMEGRDQIIVEEMHLSRLALLGIGI